jgi:hypothetical protein
MYLALDPSRRLSFESSFGNPPYRKYARMSMDSNMDSSMMRHHRPSVITHPVPDKYNMPPLSTVTENIHQYDHYYEERTPIASNAAFHPILNR